MKSKSGGPQRQWEQEIIARQKNVTPADFPEGLHYARIGGLPRIISQLRFWIGIVLSAVGLSVSRSSVPVGLAVAAVVCGLGLAITAMRWKNAR